MIRLMRSIQVNRGRRDEAIRWAREVADYLNRTRPAERPVEVFVEVFGAVGTIYWVSDFDDLAAVEQAQAESQQDEQWQALIRRSVDLFVDGSMRDLVLRAV